VSTVATDNSARNPNQRSTPTSTQPHPTTSSPPGKAGAEPASGGLQQPQRQRNIAPASLPASRPVTAIGQYDDQQQQGQQQVAVSANSFGEPLSQRRITQQPQQSYSANDDAPGPFEGVQQQQQQPVRTSTAAYSGAASGGFVPQRSVQPQQQSTGQYEQTTQQRVEVPVTSAKVSRNSSWWP
jgi:hypothetical protein